MSLECKQAHTGRADPSGMERWQQHQLMEIQTCRIPGGGLWINRSGRVSDLYSVSYDHPKPLTRKPLSMSLYFTGFIPATCEVYVLAKCLATNVDNKARIRRGGFAEMNIRVQYHMKISLSLRSLRLNI